MDTQNEAPAKGHGLDGFYDTVRRPGIARSSDGRWFAGVATGLARWLGVDPLVVRAGLILLSLFFGIGITVYLVLWLLMPTEEGDISLEKALKHGDGGSIFLLVVTAISVFGSGPWGGDWQPMRIIGTVATGVLTYYFFTRTEPGRQIAATTAESMRNASAGAAARQRSTGNAAAEAGAALSTDQQELQDRQWQAPAPREVTPAVGFAGGLAILGVAFSAAALLYTLAEAYPWPGNHMAIAVAGGLGVLGVAGVVGGMLGRRSGWLTPFSVVGIVVALATNVAPAGLTQPWRAGERIETVTSLDGNQDFQLGLGELRVDLTGISAAELAQTPANPDVVKASLGVGGLAVVIPPGTSVIVNTKGRVGEVRVDDARGDRVESQSGPGFDRSFTFGTGPTQLLVDAEVGLGEIRILQGSPS